ncbi:hypothetical protein C8F04DRAFT_922859, partial [Mycena alexandri]
IWSSMERVREARTVWRSAVQQVTELIEISTTSESSAQHVEDAIKALDMLPWDGTVKGFKVEGSVDDLTFWFTKDWLKSDHEDQMPELLASDLGLTDSSTICIQNSFFVKSLARAYSNPEAYRTAQGFAWLRRIGGSFATKDRTCLGTMANKNENHWVALAIDSEKESVSYGDGFRGTPSPLLRKHLDWWLFEHLGVAFKWGDIPVTKQNDPHLCSLLPSLSYGCFPLPKCTAAIMADERLKMFLRIVQRHKEKGFASEARDYEFTF